VDQAFRPVVVFFADMFEFLFKYPATVFPKGSSCCSRRGLPGRWIAILAIAAGLGWQMRGSRGLLSGARRWRSGLLETRFGAGAFLLWHPHKHCTCGRSRTCIRADRRFPQNEYQGGRRTRLEQGHFQLNGVCWRP